jgi:hypothetical protein
MNQDIHVFQYFYILKLYPCSCIYLYVLFLRNKALGLLNLNLFKFLGYHNRFLRYLQKHVDFFNSAFYSVRNFLDFQQLFHILLTIKIDPGEIKMICVLPLKAEIHGFPAAKLVDWLDYKCHSYSLPNLGRLKTTAWRLMG